MKSSRNISYDILRILAILMVFYNHRYTFYIADTFKSVDLKYCLLSALSIVCKCGPPLFFMVSGALLLKKEEDFKHVLLHRILRIIFVMLICTVLVMYRDNDFNFITAFSTKLNWYLYEYLAYLFMLPFFRKITVNSGKNDTFLYILLSTLFYTISGVFIFLKYNFSFMDSINLYSSGWGSSCWLFIFPITGYFLSCIISDESQTSFYKKYFLLLSVIVLPLFVYFCTMDIKNNGGANLENLREHAIYPLSCFIFITISDIYKRRKKIHFSKLLTIISGLTFGMFIIETHTNLSLNIFLKLLKYLNWQSLYWLSILSIFTQLCLYGIIIFLIKLIPGMKKII